LPEPLAPNVAFWTDVFARYRGHEVVLHDERQVDRVYAVLDFSELETSTLSEVAQERRRRDAIRQAKDKYEQILLDLAAGRASAFREDAERVEALFAAEPGDRSKYRVAASQLRTQRGLRDEFAVAIERSGLYLKAMEKVFTDRGLPWELTRLPFVESMFHTAATSKVAAGGIWQMMPSTGGRWLKINMEVDERYDPELAAAAAATYLKENHAALQTWPLAITAYNHGAGGMRRAVRTVGTRDIGEIVRRYDGRAFGFASRNFYAEFLAAAQVFENREHYFPGVNPKPAMAYDQFAPKAYVPIADLAERAGVPIAQMRELNPALTHQIWRGTLLLPAGYPLRVPQGATATFARAYEQLPAESKSDRQTGIRYRVRAGDTLSRIASSYGTTIAALQQANQLRNAHRLRIGQLLWVPPGRGAVGVTRTASAASAPREAKIHVVRSGETLSAIAARYGTSIAVLQRLNGLRSKNRIFPGQKLSIPAG
jgi:membrane-bound lytic murein transglycosylase D